MGWLLTEEDLQHSEEELKNISKDDIKAELIQKVDDLSASREELFGEQVTRELERVVMLKCVDVQWMDHIDAMDQLKRGIHLRGYAQRLSLIHIYQNRLSFFIVFNDIFNDGIVFTIFGFVNQIGVVNTFWRTVCRNFYNVQIINFTEFFFFCHSGTCHTGQLIICLLYTSQFAFAVIAKQHFH